MNDFNKEKWIVINKDDVSETEALWIYHGWLIRNRTDYGDGAVSESMVFVSDPKGEINFHE